MNNQHYARQKVLETDLEAHLYYFFRKRKGYYFQLTEFHKKLVKAFQDVIEGREKNLLILVPPRHGKTEIAKFACSMGFAQNPAAEFIYCCSDRQLALDCSSDIRSIIKSPEYQQYWNVDIRVDADAKGLWKTEQGGSFWAGSFGSPIVGYGAGKHLAALKDSQYKFGGIIIVDDPIKEQDRFRTLEREKAITFFRDTLPDRRNYKDVPMIVFMQPLHKEDLGQWIKKNRKDFEVLEFPVLDDNNNPLCPELYSYDDLMKLKAEKSTEVWRAKYMLKPVTIGGHILKSELLKHYKMLPFLKHRWIEVDTAQKTEERHDYTVFQCWGKGYDSGIYLIDQYRAKVKYTELKQRFKDFWNKHNSVDNYEPRQYGFLTSAYIEDKSSGTQIIQEAQHEGNIPITEVQRAKSKYERAVTVALPKLESGYIFVPEEAPFLSDLKDEMDDFTGEEETKNEILKVEKKKKFDDQVDCLVSACEHGFAEFVSNSELISNFMEKRLRRKK